MFELFSEFDMLVLIKVLNVGSLKFTYLVHKLAWHSHVVNIYEMFVFFNEKYSVVLHRFLDLRWEVFLQKLHYLLRT